ncbi:MAG: hypothetical protein JSW54_13665 [Fidelibacterota bacterium]|nr:MAG: hypothetical protein JSW54_13665 [Candidatus Neomarinimicrobiota bacterium]
MILLAPLFAQQGAVRTEYYRSEETFRQGIKLFLFEVHEDSYVKVVLDELGFVRLISWYTREDSLIKTRSYEYWEDDASIKRLLELTADSLIIREVLFGDEPKSREFIEYVYGVEFVPDFRNRFTEIRVDSSQQTASFKIMSTQGELIGAVFMDYDSLGFLTNETWFQGEDLRRVREFRYIFHRDSGEQEVIERGQDGQVVSHVRIKTAPHQRAGWSLGDEVEAVLDTTDIGPVVAPVDSLSGGKP